MKLSKDFKEFIELLNKHNVKYLLVGGWAVSIHAKPRYTKDIDFLIFSDFENSNSMMKALDSFGFGTVGIEAKDFQLSGKVIQLGYEPNRIDLLTSLQGIDFTVAWQRKVQLNVDGVLVNLINTIDLINNKSIVARPQDLADVALLKKLAK